MEYPSFLEHMRARFGSNWCVANRASRKTVDYDCVITPKRFALEQDAWARNHPAYILAESLPESPEKRFICKAVMSRLSYS